MLMIAVVVLLFVLGVCGLSRSSRLRWMAFLGLLALNPGLVVLLVVVGESMRVSLLLLAALTLDIAGIGYLACRCSRRGERWRDPLDLERWWGNFERDFRAYVRRQSAREDR